ncbi:MAG TPA: hypothetical protein V6C89_21945 [Drouetiella sp.]
MNLQLCDFAARKGHGGGSAGQAPRCNEKIEVRLTRLTRGGAAPVSLKKAKKPRPAVTTAHGTPIACENTKENLELA